MPTVRWKKLGSAASTTFALSLALAVALVPVSPQAGAQGEVRELEWDDLMPEGWDPFAELDALMNDELQDLADNSVRALELFDAYQEAVRSAPVVGELDGERVRLPG